MGANPLAFYAQLLSDVSRAANGERQVSCYRLLRVNPELYIVPDVRGTLYSIGGGESASYRLTGNAIRVGV